MFPPLGLVKKCSVFSGGERRVRYNGFSRDSLFLHCQDVRVTTAAVPAITEPKDVICKVTGSTVCGSDLHLYHKEIMQLKRGDILGHEWIGIVDEIGSEVRNVKVGDRVVASFQIA
jgi:threonine dehydrogenase-like Zn-dependent dehydrogenase